MYARIIFVTIAILMIAGIASANISLKEAVNWSNVTPINVEKAVSSFNVSENNIKGGLLQKIIGYKYQPRDRIVFNGGIMDELVVDQGLLSILTVDGTLPWELSNGTFITQIVVDDADTREINHNIHVFIFYNENVKGENGNYLPVAIGMSKDKRIDAESLSVYLNENSAESNEGSSGGGSGGGSSGSSAGGGGSNSAGGGHDGGPGDPSDPGPAW